MQYPLKDEKEFELASPTHLQIEVTEDCNHSCFYCYNHWKNNDTPRKNMKMKDAKRLTKIIIEDIKPFISTITGGEPFLNFDVTKYFVSELGKRDVSVGINSNLILAKKENLEEIIFANPDVSILASVPSIRRETYYKIVGKDNLPKFFQNLEVALNLKIPININMVVHQLNKDQVYEEAKFMKENYGIKKFAVTPMLRPACRELDGYDLILEENIKIFEELIRLREEEGMTTAILEVTPKCGIPEELCDDAIFSRGCSAGKITSAISYDGDLRVCAHAPFSEGNILEESFKDVWKRMKPWRIHGYIPSDCCDCVELQDCRGGCRFAAYQEGQPLDTKDYRCGKPILSRKVIESPDIDINQEYIVKPFKYREEHKGEYTLYNQGTIIFANEELKEFLDLVYEEGGINLSDIPEGSLRDKASSLGKILYYKGFLRKK